jgi:hypothetical protein
MHQGRERAIVAILTEVMRVVEMVTMSEMTQIFEVTDRLGIHREQVVVPLGPRHPGRVRKMANGKFEIVVEAEGALADWLPSMEAELVKLLG